MNNEQIIDTDDLPLTDELVCTYLQDNPSFFNRNTHLLSTIKIADKRRGTVSLIERQQEQLRHKVQGLEDEVTQLMSIANQNEQLFTHYSDLYLQLIDCNSTYELLDCLHQTMTELLSLSDFKLWLKSPTSIIKHHSLVEGNCAELMKSRFVNSDYYFGRLQKSEQALIFSESASESFSESNVGSVVLIKLTHDSKTLGFIAISSEDAHHFDPRMDTLLLSRFRKLVAKLLQQKLAL